MVIAFLCLSKCLRDCSFMSRPAIRQLLVAAGEVYDCQAHDQTQLQQPLM